MADNDASFTRARPPAPAALPARPARLVVRPEDDAIAVPDRNRLHHAAGRARSRIVSAGELDECIVDRRLDDAAISRLVGAFLVT